MEAMISALNTYIGASDEQRRSKIFGKGTRHATNRPRQEFDQCVPAD